MARYLNLQRYRQLKGLGLDGNVLEDLYAKLIEELCKDCLAISKMKPDALYQESSMRYLHDAIREQTHTITINRFIRYLSRPLTLPIEPFEEGIQGGMRSLDISLNESLEGIEQGATAFLPPLLVESAAYAAVLEFLGFPQLSTRLRNSVEEKLNCFIFQYLEGSLSGQASHGFAVQTHQPRLLNQAMQTLDELKEIYLQFAQGLKLKI